ncbi:MAG: HAD-IIIC family phosphatase, partial [Nitrospirae bacterium]|nr:HAD-IIIC family phosphatase [Nitrospirota bacterium]
MIKKLTYPFDVEYILRKKRSIRRELKAALDERRRCNEHIVSIKIAILGGSTTSEIKELLELFLLQEGIEPTFYESEYNKYYEDIMFDNEELRRFAPHIIYIHTTNRNITGYPDVTDSPETVENKFCAEAEAYTEFQQYLRKLNARGVLLAVCSKNDENVALERLNHRNGILRPDDFVVIKANWQPKDANICEIVKEINITLDSVVFLDDNPFERDIVRSQLPVVEVPDTLMDEVTRYIECIDRACYFEPVILSEDDIKRNAFYQETQERCTLQSKFATYEEFLISLEMVAEINSFKPIYLDRIVQLINKTNQFNLTTKRYT